MILLIGVPFAAFVHSGISLTLILYILPMSVKIISVSIVLVEIVFKTISSELFIPFPFAFWTIAILYRWSKGYAKEYWQGIVCSPFCDMKPNSFPFFTTNGTSVAAMLL